MPQVDITNEGIVRVTRIGVQPVYADSVASVALKIQNNAAFISPTDPNQCANQIGGQSGLSVQVTAFVDGAQAAQKVVCVEQIHNDPEGQHAQIDVPFDVAVGQHELRFHFEFESGGETEIGEASYTVEKLQSLEGSEWEPLDPDQDHETGDIVEVNTWLDSDAPLPRLAFELRADLLRLQAEMNAEFPGEERITILNTELVKADDPNHDYRYRMRYHVDQASPIAASTVVTVLAIVIGAILVSYFINETLINARKLVSTPAGAAALNIWGLAAAGGVLYLLVGKGQEIVPGGEG